MSASIVNVLNLRNYEHMSMQTGVVSLRKN
jgi:hypothetical protein